MDTGTAIYETLISPNVSDRNLEPANIVDVIDGLTSSTRQIARAITPSDAMPGPDATGGQVGSLTEAIMGLTAAMVQIATAIASVAEAVRET